MKTKLRVTSRRSLSGATFSAYHVLRGQIVVATIVGHVQAATWGRPYSAIYSIVEGDAMAGSAFVRRFTPAIKSFRSLADAKASVRAGLVAPGGVA